MRHAVEFRDRVEIIDPRLLRANKYLPARHQFISLAKRSKPHVIGFWLIASRCGIDRRPAVRAESFGFTSNFAAVLRTLMPPAKASRLPSRLARCRPARTRS